MKIVTSLFFKVFSFDIYLTSCNCSSKKFTVNQKKPAGLGFLEKPGFSEPCIKVPSSIVYLFPARLRPVVLFMHAATQFVCLIVHNLAPISELILESDIVVLILLV